MGFQDLIVLKHNYLASTANLVILAMEAAIPCARILTGKIFFNYREYLLSLQGSVHIAGNLFSKQVVPWTPPALPCVIYRLNIFNY